MANRNRNKTNDQLATEGDETKTVETTETTTEVSEETTETTTTEEGEKPETEEKVEEATEKPEEKPEEPVKEETKTVETEAKTEPVKPKKEWKYDFKPGDSVTIWGTGEFATMKKGTKHNTTGAMAAILVEKGAASLTEIKPDEEK